MKWPKISIIVPAYNEEEIIEETIHHLAYELKYPNKEIIIGVDDGTDRTLEIVKKYAKKGVVKYIHSKKRLGMAGMVMKLLKEAGSDIILKMDADMRLHNEKTALFLIAKAFEDPKVGGIVWFGEDFSKINEVEKSLIARGEVFVNRLVSNYRKQFYPLEGIPEVPTLSVQCFRKSAINQDVDPSDIICMDDEIGLMILKNGYKIIYLEGVSVYFYGIPNNPKTLFMQKRRGIAGWFKLGEKYKIDIIKYYFNIFVYFIKNIRKYHWKDIVAFFYWLTIFVFAMVIAYIQRKNPPTSLWVKTPRK